MSYGIVKSREIVGAGDKKSSTRKKEKKKKRMFYQKVWDYLAWI